MPTKEIFRAALTELSPRDHIEQIRRNKYGIARDDMSQGKNYLADDLHAAVEQLSEGLYRKDVHFILELIQNAEDNAYPADTRPEITFRLLDNDLFGARTGDGTLVIVNNEIGFEVSDVESICSVGRSEKAKKKSGGYIGEKGIGFKSVFQVSKTPHIFSGGNQFYFDEERHPVAGLGYIVPTWVDAIPNQLSADQGNTMIVLPLKAGRRQTVEKELSTIAAETILFLNKLDRLRIEVGDEVTDIARERRSKEPNGEVHLRKQSTSGSTIAKYWVWKSNVQKPPDVTEEKRAEVSERVVSVALPLGEDFPKQRVFAFLPTEEESGLPFLVNADFLVTSSRENIDIDKSWNIWLRDSIAPTFVEAFEALLQRKRHRIGAYRCIPLEGGAANGFLLPVVSCIYSKLVDKKVVLTDRGELVIPARARRASEEQRKLLEGSTQPKHLANTPLTHPDLDNWKDQLAAIGVPELSPYEFLGCLADRQWVRTKCEEDTNWLIDLYCYLAKSPSIFTKDKIAALRLFPIRGRHTLASLDEGLLRLPGQDKIDTSKLPDKTLVKWRLLEEKIWERIRDNGQVRTWLRTTLGIELLSVSTIVKAAVGELQLQARVRTLSAETLLKWTDYIRRHYDPKDKTSADAVHSQIPLLLVDGTILGFRDGTLVMPEAVDPMSGWQLVFPDKEDRRDWHVLSVQYFVDVRGESEVAELVGFLGRLGCTSAPIKRREWEQRGDYRDHHLYIKESWENDDKPTDWALKKISSFRSTRWMRVHDYLPPQWLKSALKPPGNLEVSRTRSRPLMVWLEHLLRADSLGTIRHGRVEGAFGGNDKRIDFDSELVHYLRSAPWFPSSKGPQKPSDVFEDKPAIRDILGTHVAYAAHQVKPEIARLIGLRTEITDEVLIDYLKSLASQPASADDLDKVIVIYKQLNTRAFPLLETVFRSQPLILALDPAPKWLRSNEILWDARDQDVFGDAFSYLSDSYRDLKSFFTTKLKVREHPDDETYAGALVRLSEQFDQKDIESSKVDKTIKVVYDRLARNAGEPGGKDKLVGSDSSLFRQSPKLWTKGSRFQSPDRMFIADDKANEARFREKGVDFAWFPGQENSQRYRKMLEFFGVRSLSESVQTTLLEANPDEDAGADALLADDAKIAVCRYLYTKENGSLYKERKEDNALALFLATTESAAKRIEVRYSLEVARFEVQRIDEHAYVFWDKDDSLLHLTRQEERDLDINAVAAVLARGLDGSRNTDAFENFLRSVIGKSARVIEDVCNRNDLDLLPDEEQMWVRSKVISSALPSEVEDVTEVFAPKIEVAGAGQARGVDLLSESAEPHMQLDNAVEGSEAADEQNNAGNQPRVADRQEIGMHRGPQPQGETLAATESRSTGPAVWDSSQTNQTERELASRSKETDHTLAHRGISSPAGSRSSALRRRPASRLPADLKWSAPTLRTSTTDTEASDEYYSSDEWEIDEAGHLRRNEVANAGVKFVLSYEKDEVGRIAKDMNEEQPNHPGFDIESYAKGDSGVSRYIEVKSQREAGNPITLTRREMLSALELRNKYFLYVVEYALDDRQRRLRVIQDPVKALAGFPVGGDWTECAIEVYPSVEL